MAALRRSKAVLEGLSSGSWSSVVVVASEEGGVGEWLGLSLRSVGRERRALEVVVCRLGR
jgi:hypothetical protein